MDRNPMDNSQTDHQNGAIKMEFETPYYNPVLLQDFTRLPPPPPPPPPPAASLLPSPSSVSTLQPPHQLQLQPTSTIYRRLPYPHPSSIQQGNFSNPQYLPVQQSHQIRGAFQQPMYNSGYTHLNTPPPPQPQQQQIFSESSSSGTSPSSISSSSSSPPPTPTSSLSSASYCVSISPYTIVRPPPSTVPRFINIQQPPPSLPSTPPPPPTANNKNTFSSYKPPNFNVPPPNYNKTSSTTTDLSSYNRVSSVPSINFSCLPPPPPVPQFPQFPPITQPSRLPLPISSSSSSQKHQMPSIKSELSPYAINFPIDFTKPPPTPQLKPKPKPQPITQSQSHHHNTNYKNYKTKESSSSFYNNKQQQQSSSSSSSSAAGPSKSNNYFKNRTNQNYISNENNTNNNNNNTHHHNNNNNNNNHNNDHHTPNALKYSERQILLNKWRSNFCETPDDITRKLAELESNDDCTTWIRSSPADIYYKRINDTQVESTLRLDALCALFDEELNVRGKHIRLQQEPYLVPHKKRRQLVCRHKSEKCPSDSSSSDEYDVEEENCAMEELTRKIKHPYRLHPDIWHNEAGDMNDGPLCRCSAKSRQTGIRHNVYPGEKLYPKCMANSNNTGKLHHYRITISPPTNFLTKTPTIIKHDQHEFIFEGFSLFSHEPIGELPTCKVIRFNIEYTIYYVEEQMPDNFTIQELDVFYEYLFVELLEMIDFNLKPKTGDANACSCYHFLPRFVRDLPNNGKEVLAMAEVLKYLLDSSGPLVSQAILDNMLNVTQSEWQNYADNIKDMVVTNPGMRPCSIRVDQLDRNVSDLPECVDPENADIFHPIIVHFGIKPPQLSYVGNPEYQKAWREYVKYRHLIANMSKPTYIDKRKLEFKESKLQDMRTQGRMKRNITVAISSKGFYRTGIMCDVVQHAMLIPVLTTHLRVHLALDVLESRINYTFTNRYLLQLALTHPSYKENFGTNPDHARNSLTNCGIRQPEYGDRKIHYLNTRKRGINTLINIMSRFGKEYETDSNISHNERLEFLGDAVVEFLSSIHLFFMFPEVEEGGLATYRAAIVQNQHLALLAKTLQLDEFMLYAHGSDLCHELELRHAMANCFEALMGALLLDGGIDVADKVFALALFNSDNDLKNLWDHVPPHPLQEQEPLGDRQWINRFALLRHLTEFEELIGIKFRHIRLLARAFTDRSVGYTHLTLGSNQRLEFLGDTVLQLICSEYLYRHFPEHHEGHLSLLRSSLVNNRTEAVVCNDLGMTQYAIYSTPKGELKTKDRADLLEAFLGALYVDRGLEICRVFCQVCLFPRLQMFIMNQDWNDPKSKLQQCCLTLRTMDGGEPDIPIYKVIECIGPTNTRVYTVAVYFRGKRLASANGHSIQQAEMNAAKSALESSRHLFPQLDHQKRVIAKSIKRQRGDRSYDLGAFRKATNDNTNTNNNNNNNSNHNSTQRQSQTHSPVQLSQQEQQQQYHQRPNYNRHRRSQSLLEDESNLPKQYRTREDISSDELNLSTNDSELDEYTDNAMVCTTTVVRKKHKKARKKHKRTKSKEPPQQIVNTEDISDEHSSFSDCDNLVIDMDYIERNTETNVVTPNVDDSFINISYKTIIPPPSTDHHRSSTAVTSENSTYKESKNDNVLNTFNNDLYEDIGSETSIESGEIL